MPLLQCGVTRRKTEAYLNANAQFATPSGIPRVFDRNDRSSWTHFVHHMCTVHGFSQRKQLKQTRKGSDCLFLCHYNITEAAVLGEWLQKVASNLLEHGKWQQCVRAILVHAMIMIIAIILTCNYSHQSSQTHRFLQVCFSSVCSNAFQQYFSPSSHLSIQAWSRWGAISICSCHHPYIAMGAYSKCQWTLRIQSFLLQVLPGRKSQEVCTFHHIWQTFCSRNQRQQLQVLLPSAFALPHDHLNRAQSISLCVKTKVFPAGRDAKTGMSELRSLKLT